MIKFSWENGSVEKAISRLEAMKLAAELAREHGTIQVTDLETKQVLYNARSSGKITELLLPEIIGPLEVL